jgi:hypothetical protein
MSERSAIAKFRRILETRQSITGAVVLTRTHALELLAEIDQLERLAARADVLLDETQQRMLEERLEAEGRRNADD